MSRCANMHFFCMHCCATRAVSQTHSFTVKQVWCHALLLAGTSALVLPAGAVGVYVPGGTAVLPSSALMLTVPAQIAGCRTIVLATPPRPDGSITPEVVWAAKKAGVTHVLKAGGAQAVAAMAWGTESCPKVVAGPGLSEPLAVGRDLKLLHAVQSQLATLSRKAALPCAFAARPCTV